MLANSLDQPILVQSINTPEITSLRDNLLKKGDLLSEDDIHQALSLIESLSLTRAAGQKTILALQKQLILSY